MYTSELLITFDREMTGEFDCVHSNTAPKMSSRVFPAFLSATDPYKLTDKHTYAKNLKGVWLVSVAR